MQAFLKDQALDSRVAHLEARLRESKPDWQEITPRLPEDPQARAAALATVLGLDALHVLREGGTLELLEQQREARRQAAEQVDREARRQEYHGWTIKKDV